ncbi:hypothetical protein R3W88_029955 [Solanum pinnatisectum]|uniref:Uncharacterized protein n=1 Tax=Solanum pinnatisectum TaxID=50273 RepID=A0AAV9K6T6_9SOLN|nr:hypothetical protein R3W88_029955 [Solanum pinnatisectum]
MINQIHGLLKLRRREEEWRCEGLAGSLLLLSSSMGFAGDYLAFCWNWLLAAHWSEQLELLFVVVVITGAEEKRERGSPVGAGPRVASGRHDLRLLARRKDRRQRLVSGRLCSLLRLNC